MEAAGGEESVQKLLNIEDDVEQKLDQDDGQGGDDTWVDIKDSSTLIVKNYIYIYCPLQKKVYTMKSQIPFMIRV